MKSINIREISPIRKTLGLARRIKGRVIVARAAASQGLETRHFDFWHSDLDEPLSLLPESSVCPHELFRLLVKNPGHARKRIVLVMDNKEPVAVVGLREGPGYWEPVTQWLVPGMIFPVAEGYIWRVLGAIGLPLNVAWWRWKSPPSSHPWVKDVKATPTRGVPCSADFEGFWRQTSHLRNIRNVRKRCQGFEIKINEPCIRDWTIINWGEKWGKGGTSGMRDLPDRLLVAQYLDSKNLFYTISMHDKGTPIAGVTLLVHDKDVVGYVNHRNSDYDSFGIMNRLIDYSFFWAKESGFSNYDIGGTGEYKKKWAPINGEKYQFIV